MNITKFMKKCLKNWDSPTCIFTIVFLVFIIYYLHKNHVFREGFGKKEKLSKVLYCYWKDCGYCKQFNPIWDEFYSQEGGNSDIELIKVEKDDNYNKAMGMSGPDIMKKFNITGYPSILLLDNNNNKIDDYKGPRTLDGLKELLN